MKPNACEIQLPEAYILIIKKEELNLVPFKSDSEKQMAMWLVTDIAIKTYLIKTDYHYLHFLLSLAIELI